ncbi:MAG TPA: heme exporter protein CcmB [Rhizomicrobium sp.]|jgi:heme exporter protein B
MSFFTIVARDVRLAMRGGGGAFLALAFFAMTVTLVPLAVGPDLKILSAICVGLLWVAASLASLLSLDRLFQADFDDGSLDLLALGPVSLETLAFAKIAAHWLTTGLPLTLLAPAMALLLNLPARGYVALICALAIGTPAISALGAVGASLTLAIRRGGLILPLIVMPLLAPVLIFGSGAVRSAIDGLANGGFFFLAAFSLAAVLLSPFAAAAGLRLNLGT